MNYHFRLVLRTCGEIIAVGTSGRIVIVFILMVIFAGTVQAEDQKLILNFFGSPTCDECLDIKQTILIPARDAHPKKIDLHIHDIGSDSGFTLLMDMEERYGVKASAAIELFFPDTFLTGSEDIHTHGKILIEQYLVDLKECIRKGERSR